MTTTGKSRGFQDAEDPNSFRHWHDLLAEDSRPVPEHLLEKSPHVADGLVHSVAVKEFTSQAVHDLEREKLWFRVWQIACRENDIPNVGDYCEYTICERSVLIVRDGPDSIKAFSSTCSHRGAQVACGQGNVKSFSCPYHGWLYGLDGSLLHIPAAWDFDVDLSRNGLRSYRLERFEGWVFINMDPNAAPLKEFLGETLIRHLSAHPRGRMWKKLHLGGIIPCNWKVFVHAFSESYHLGRVHPEITPFNGDLQTDFDFYGLHFRLSAPTGTPSVIPGGEFSEQEMADAFIELYSANSTALNEEFQGRQQDAGIKVPDGQTARRVLAEMIREKSAAAGLNLSDVSDAEILDPIDYFIFPNIKWFINPVGPMTFRLSPHRNDPNTSFFEVMFLTPVPEGTAYPKDAPLQIIEPGKSFSDYSELVGVFGAIVDQDVRTCMNVQKSLRGGAIERIQLAKTMEAAIARFQRNLANWCAA